MGRSIWKYTLSITDTQTIDMPSNAEILSVDNQGGSICVWALVNTDNPPETRKFAIRGTGQPWGTEMNHSRFIGTVIVSPFVWHVFEIG